MKTIFRFNTFILGIHGSLWMPIMLVVNGTACNHILTVCLNDGHQNMCRQKVRIRFVRNRKKS